MAWNASNITITGGGLIDGNGAAWYECAAQKLRTAPCNGYSRPQLLRPVYVNGFYLNNVTLKNSPSWTIHLAWVTGAELRNFTVTAPYNQGNTDGVDIDCSHDVLISDFLYAGGDDAIAVKAGEDWFGWTYGRPTNNATIRRMTILSGNGFAIGSEESAGVHNVLFDDILVNCTTDPMRCKHGLYIKAARGRGGVVSNITVNNTVTAGIYTYFGGITLDYTRPQPPPTNVTATPYVHNVTFSNSVATGGGGMAFDFAGLPESVLTGIRIVNVTAHQGVANGGCVNATGTCEGTNVCPKCFQPAD